MFSCGNKNTELLQNINSLSDVELLAPATASTYKTAIACGADAIYFGFGSLNARATAENLDDFTEIVSYCHKFGVKAYLALNIMLKNSELDYAKEVVKKAEEAKIDAFIISDLALISIIRQFSKTDIHASTQMGIHNTSGAKFCKSLGIKRVILSRETTPKDIVEIKKQGLEVEIFCHGAICIGFSGACLFSSMLTGKSGNRGRCLQLCRRNYSLFINGEKTIDGFLLSSKDNCLAPRIKEIPSMGVDSLKIEGRLKNKNYVEGVTSIYSSLKKGLMEYDNEVETKLKACFNRGNFTCGYWDNNDVVYKSAPNHIGVYFGKIQKVISKNLVLIETKSKVSKDDSFRVIRSGKEIGGIVATGEVKNLGNKIGYVCFAPCEVKTGDLIYLTKTESISLPQNKIKINLSILMLADENIKITAKCRNIEYSYVGERGQRAISNPLSKNEVVSQFSRTGNSDYIFEFDNVIVEDIFMPKSQLNQLRRLILDYFEKALVNDYERNVSGFLPVVSSKNKISGDFVQISDKNQLSAVKSIFKNIVYSPNNYFYEDCLDFYKSAKTSTNNIFLILPIFINTSNEGFARNLISVFDGVVANNPGVYQMALEEGKIVVAGWNLNIANNQNYFLLNSDQAVISTELNAKELADFPDSLVYVYGNLTLMYLNYCPKRLAFGSCKNCNDVKEISLRDDKGEYPIITKKINGTCQHEMKNSVCTNLGGLLKGNPKYFDFCGMENTQITTVLQIYFSGTTQTDISKYNHLHINRGVE